MDMNRTDRERQKAAEQRSLDVAEAAREQTWDSPSFVGELFQGRFRFDLIAPFPTPSAEDQQRTERYIQSLIEFLEANVDSDEIDRTGELPEAVVQGLRDLGAFGLKIPTEYGGVGLSQLGYGKTIQAVARFDGNLTALLSAHQSIGVPQPLKLFGTPEQKQEFLPRIARGAISAFALTEAGVGSDPAAMQTTAIPTDDGEAFVINGEKLWCTNGTMAELLVVMARTPSKIKDGKEIPQITAFIVDTRTPGVQVTHRCRFMGLKAIQNAVIRFENVRVPKENILWGEGKGLKLALVTLNTGRLTLPMCVAGMGKECLKIVREWSNERVQWGMPIGKHDAVAQKIGEMAAQTFAVEAMAELSSLLADRGGADIRLEAAIGKLWATELGWKMIDETLQIRGGRGYETADSLRARGEPPIPVERMMRDFRINRIFEGTSEIMRLFIAREAVDPHLKVAGALAKPGSTLGEKLTALLRMKIYYAFWFPSRWIGWGHWPRFLRYGRLAKHLRYIDRTSRRLARCVFYAMALNGPKLQYRQALLGRLVDIGSELFAMSAACSRAHAMRQGEQGNEALQLADLFCRRSRETIEKLFDDLFSNEDRATYRTAQDVLAGRHLWLESHNPSHP